MSIELNACGMSGFTSLEQRVIAATCDLHPEVADGLRRLLATARVTERENTGAGFFTTFEVDHGLPPVVWTEGGPIIGPDPEVQVGEDVLLMGFLIWLKDGYPDCLEGYQFCTTDGRELDLKATSLDVLTWLRDPAAPGTE